MPRSVSWRKLVPGAIILAAIVGIALWVLLYARVGALRGDMVTVYTATSGARGLFKGSDVWLAGQLVGQVEDIRFRSLASDTVNRVLIEMRILQEHRHNLRRDARAQIRSGGTLIGAQVVHLSIGSPDSEPVSDGDTLRSAPQPDTEGVASQIASASRHFPEIARNVGMIGREITEASNALGLEDGSGVVQLDLLRRRSQSLARQARGDGSVARTMRDTSLAARARAALAHTDTLRALLASDRGVLGRFRRDSTLGAAITDLRAEVSIVQALIGRAEGTAGRAVNDEAIRDALGAAERELGTLIEDLKRRPTRYIVF